MVGVSYRIESPRPVTRLSVNVNKIAWLRNARQGAEPNVRDCCTTILDAGAHGITVHPRPDQRHIVPNDVYEISELLQHRSNVEFNIEGNPSAGERDNGYPGFASLVEQTKPQQCTLVPDTDSQLTSDHGWDLKDAETFAIARRHVAFYRDLGIRTSLFLDPDEEQVELAAELGTNRIELYTGPWVDSTRAYGLTSAEAAGMLVTYRTASETARRLGLAVNAGHDLNQHNLKAFCAIGGIEEVSIGHALISEALFDGLATTVQSYLSALGQQPTN